MGARRLTYIVAAAISAAAIIIVCIGSAWRHRAPDTPQASTAAAREISPSEDMAAWLLREGRMSLRRGAHARARYSAGLAEFFAPGAGGKALAETIDRRRKEIEMVAADEASDAREAGDAQRLERANAALSRMREER